MYVLMDMEWVTNKAGQQFPTQIAAMRVDENWSTEKRLFTRIRPANESFFLWDHMGFTGGYANEFLSAPPVEEAEKILLSWLREDDILCWWGDHALGLFREMFPRIAQPHAVIFPALRKYLRFSPFLIGNAYHILNRLAHTPPEMQHFSKNDVVAMCSALAAIQFPQALLAADPERSPEYYAADVRPFLLDLNTQTVHRRSCPEVSAASAIKEYTTLKNLVGRCRPCDCCAEDLANARRRKNSDTIARSEYAFVYGYGASVFHRRSCSLALDLENISGAVYYQSCIQAGKTPCPLCKPTKADEAPSLLKTHTEGKRKFTVGIPVRMPPKTKPKPRPQPNNPFGRLLPAAEQRAYERLLQAQAERLTFGEDDTLTEQQRADKVSLTQPSKAFWAASGYSSFHLRHCKKLGSLSHLKDFSLYEDAIRAGYQPCRHCKPTRKHELTVSFPIYSKEREGESVEDLTELCQTAGFLCSQSPEYTQLETPMGIWRVHTDAKPYTLEHINKLYGAGELHTQPRLFLSLEDVFLYIKKHDAISDETNSADPS